MTAYLDSPVPAGALRLFCFPYAGGGSVLYRRWRNRLGPGVAICPVQLPGRERRAGEARFTDLGAQVAELDAELGPHLDTPHAFFGHSMGALLAYRLAQRRQARGASLPRALVLSSPPTTGSPLGRVAAAAATDPMALARQLVELGGLPGDVLARPDWLDVLLPVVRDDLTMCESAAADEAAAAHDEALVADPFWRASPLSRSAPTALGRAALLQALPMPFHVFGGQYDPLVTGAELAGWQARTLVAAEVRMFPGGHFYLREVQEQVLGVLRATLARYVDDAATRRTRATAWEAERGVATLGRPTGPVPRS